MKDLNYQLKQLCRRNREGSYTTQRDREHTLAHIADQLHGLRYQHLSVNSLKAKHVDALVKLWTASGIGAGTMKNRMAVLRWWAEKVGLKHVVARSNDHYGIPNRQFVTNVSKAADLPAAKLARVADEYVRMSLELQLAFGLRREEAIKFRPVYADRGDHIQLKDTWTKGGKARTVPVRTAEQRDVLDRARRLAGNGSLIPDARRYIDQRRVYERHTANAGLSKMHGLRHAYAQARYRELTGWPAPAAGGPTARRMSDKQRAIDQRARLTISVELGHEREQITSVYLGR